MRIIAVLAVGLAVAGCSSGQESGQPVASGTAQSTTPSVTSAPGSTSTPATSTTPTTAPAPGVTPTDAAQPASTRCTADMLRGTLQGGNPAAGNRYARLIVTNVGSRMCTLFGYGGLQLAGADGRPLPTSTRRDEPPAPALVRLSPGAQAAKVLHWGVVPSGDEPVDRPCQPEPRTLKVIPPDDTVQFAVDWNFGPVCAAGTIHDSGYYPM